MDSFLFVQEEIDVQSFIAYMLELFFASKKYADLTSASEAKAKILQDKESQDVIEANLETISGFISDKFSLVMPIHKNKLHVMLQIIKFYLIKDFYPPEQVSVLYTSKVEPRMLVVDYFIDVLFSSRESYFEYYPLDQQIILDARNFIFIEMETIDDLVRLFNRLSEANIKKIAKPSKMKWIIEKFPRSTDDELLIARAKDYINSSLNKPIFDMFESRWGESKYRNVEADKPIEAKNMKHLYYFCQDWIQILEDPTILNENRLQFLHLLQEIYYAKARVRMQDLETLRK
jgi:hypothetical protein